ncbi:MAG: FkbM family methyltransferase [Ignavibacteriaceae bacterium]|nr:FkbM family methyltransferase [Ignavibacteriaceae bacterium]
MKLKNHLPSFLYNPSLNFYNKFINRYYQKSYAQEGEDLILYRMIYGKIEKGFYVDVGAHHPKRFSNTYFFYEQGWQGINIEPMPGSKRNFDKVRPRDINLEIPINSTEEELTYYIFNDPALNGFSKDISLLRNQSPDYRIIKTVNMKTKTLSSVLNEHLSGGQKINLLSIDVEGLDIEVLKSNDWRNYKPDFIMVEEKEFNIVKPEQSNIFSFLQQMNYQLVAKTLSTLIFSLR